MRKQDKIVLSFVIAATILVVILEGHRYMKIREERIHQQKIEEFKNLFDDKHGPRRINMRTLTTDLSIWYY